MSENFELSVKLREAMYRLMISQLFKDGFKEQAASLAQVIKPFPDCTPGDHLKDIVQKGLRLEEERNAGQQKATLRMGSVSDIDIRMNTQTGMDLEVETEVQTMSTEVSLYETCYVTAHKTACRAAKFHHCGQLVATGSVDTSIKILDVERMLAKGVTPYDVSSIEPHVQLHVDSHPVIRTLYDHSEEVTCLDFHPTVQILVSGSKDYSVRFFNISKTSAKKAFKSIQESAAVRCVAFHSAGGDHLLVGTFHPTLRMYDMQSLQCFVGSDPQDQHTGPINAVDWSADARMYTSCSKDGDIKVWDSVSSRCITTFRFAHQSQEVCSVVFSRNGKYILSSGKDSLVKLWELSTNRCLIVYTGAGATGRMQHRTQAVFNHTEDYVLFPDEKTTSLCCWDSRNAERQNLLALGHNGPVRALAHSPTGPSFVSCSDDFRARFWYRRAATC